MQIAYNTQNLVGTGCYESKDGGLSDFGQEVIAEMNRLGILCDLSHVGPKTSEDVIQQLLAVTGDPEVAKYEKRRKASNP